MAETCFWILLGMAVFQAVFGLQFAAVLRRRSKPLPDDELPKVSILLPLRGADPELQNTLTRLMRLDYPHYDLRVIVDSTSDPAWDLVQRAVQAEQAAHVHVTTVREYFSTCSPQCSALFQAASELPDDCEVVAILDGDVVVHPNWLRELVAPLADPTVGIAHGNRWFMPSDGNWGSLVRYLWNAAAIVPMYVFGIPWAGTFAIRRRVLLESGLFESWPRSVVPDAPALKMLRKMNLSIRFVPSLMMPNWEACDLNFALDFQKRQMMWTRTYHPGWLPVLIHAVVTTAFLAAVTLLAVFAACIGDTSALWASAGGLAIYLATMLSLLLILELSVRRVLRARGERTAWLTPRVLWRLLPAIPLTQVVYMFAVLLAHLRKRVTWRGVTYLIRGPWDVQIETMQAVRATQAGSNLSV